MILKRALKSVFSPANDRPRLSMREYLSVCQEHFLRNWRYYALPVFSVLLFQTFFRFDVNYTESLPHHVFLTVKGYTGNLEAGDYVAYRFPTDNPASPFQKGDHMVKIIAGVSGDIVTMTAEREFLLAKQSESVSLRALGGHSLGVAKERSKKGWALEPGPTGIIPEEQFYVFAPHKDSLDSRYAMVGWIARSDLIGKAYVLF